MFFNSLSQSVSKALNSIKGKAVVTSKDFDNMTEEIFAALLDSDVALSVAKDFINSVKDKVVGKKIIKKFSPANAIMKIVKEEITQILGTGFEGIKFNALPPVVIMMVGLQGSGKTTTSAKAAFYLIKKFKKKVLLASLDVYRPAAKEQLKILGEQNDIDTLDIIDEEEPKQTASRSLKTAKSGGYDVLILDTAGRLHIDKELMNELEIVKSIAKPIEILLVIDSMTGQDAINIVKNFNDALGLTGVVLTRMDGDSKGGVALSVRSLTTCPIKFFGSGEKIADFEEFYPERIANRIIGMGDLLSLVEKASHGVDEKEVDSLKEKMKKGEFDFNDLSWQFKTLNSLGGITKLLNFLPGMGAFNVPGNTKMINNDVFKKSIAIIDSMTKNERKNPQIINSSRKMRIAQGSGTKLNDVNVLMKQFAQAKTLFASIGKSGVQGLKNIKPENVMDLFRGK